MKSGADGKATLRYTPSDRPEDIFEDFDYVVSAVPFTMLRLMDIFPSFSIQKKQALEEFIMRIHRRLSSSAENVFGKSRGFFGVYLIPTIS